MSDVTAAIAHALLITDPDPGMKKMTTRLRSNPTPAFLKWLAWAIDEEMLMLAPAK